MSTVSVREIKEALSIIASDVLSNPVDSKQEDLAMTLKVCLKYVNGFKSVRENGSAAAVAFEQIGDYETANRINATIEAAF
jgi:hypothetical protein